jgi:hypothetical protein
MSLSKYLMVGLGVSAVAGGLLWLSRDSTQAVKFDPKVHTLQRLHEILEETFLEYGCSYVFFYNTILNLKEQGQFKQEILDSIEVRVKDYTKIRDETICRRHGISPDLLEQWVLANKADPQVKNVLKSIDDLHTQLIVKQHIDEMIFEIPAELTREVYLQIARKVQACVRHDAYNQVQKFIKSEGKDQITDEEMDKILEQIG